jgi:hypothetical protein
MAHAMDRVAGDVLQCLAPGDGAAIVDGEFVGATGLFRVTRVEAARGSLAFAATQCVREVAGRAHVRPFADTTAAFSHSFMPTAPATAIVADDAGTAVATVAPRVTPTLPPVAPSGPSPNELVRREAVAYRACYEREALSREHDVSGSIEVHLVLDASGAITQLSTRPQSSSTDTTLMELVARCVEQRVRAITFGPQTDAGTEIVVPLGFSPESTP